MTLHPGRMTPKAMRHRMIRQRNQRMLARNAQERLLNDDTVAWSYYDEGHVVVASATQLYYCPDELGCAQHTSLAMGSHSSQWLRSVAAFMIIILPTRIGHLLSMHVRH